MIIDPFPTQMYFQIKQAFPYVLGKSKRSQNLSLWSNFDTQICLILTEIPRQDYVLLWVSSLQANNIYHYNYWQLVNQPLDAVVTLGGCIRQ